MTESDALIRMDKKAAAYPVSSSSAGLSQFVLHWSPRSPFVRKVMIVAHELEMVDRLTLVRSVVPTGDSDHPIFRDNPLGTIPALVMPDGGTLAGSSTICLYLAEVAKSPLLPVDDGARWQVLALQEMADGFLTTLVARVIERFRGNDSFTVSECARLDMKIGKVLDWLEGQSALLAKSEFSLAHVGVASALGYLDFRYQDLDWRSGRPRLKELAVILAARPSVAATIPVED